MPRITRTMKNDFAPEPRALTTEEKLRISNPGLKELWEQYQTMLKLLMPAESIKEDKRPLPLGPMKRKQIIR